MDFFPVGGELTSGKPDIKEGLYFGEELGPEDARVQAGLPLHGANQFTASVPELRGLVLDFMRAAEVSAQAILEGVALSLGLEADYFRRTYTAQPTMLFRIFHYPASDAAEGWGVGEHTDYGLLTLLAQDDNRRATGKDAEWRLDRCAAHSGHAGGVISATCSTG